MGTAIARIPVNPVIPRSEHARCTTRPGQSIRAERCAIEKHRCECFAPTSARWRRDPDMHAGNRNRTIHRWRQIINVGVKHPRTTDRNRIAMRECLTLSAVSARDSGYLAAGQRADMTRGLRLLEFTASNPIMPRL
jgi:hypothetical protein